MEIAFLVISILELVCLYSIAVGIGTIADILIDKEKEGWTLCEMGELADIMKDLAMTEKGIAKAHYYHSEHSEEVF